ncbi:MAG TPA: hypothetical protein VKQ36_15265, partial [Ktedonobacterales bacterium]|nr:hypothetical protein [Ktedonobacterales bacterium]
TLESSFPVTITQYALATTATTTRWAHITWVGPGQASGGQGWVPNSALGTSSSSAAKQIGDLGALSITLGQAMAPYGTHFLGDIYFPGDGSRFSAASTAHSFALSSGLRAVLLVALYSNQEKHPTTPNLTLFNGVARGDNTSASTAYNQLGGAKGVGKFLGAYAISGIHLTNNNWKGAQATTLALVQFYEDADGVGNSHILNQSDQQTVRTDLINANVASVAQLGAQRLLGASGLLVVDVGSDSSGSWAIAAGVLTPQGAPTAVVVAVAQGQSSTKAAMAALQTFFKQLGLTLIG